MKKFFVLILVFALFIAESKAQPGFDDDVEDAPIPGGWILVAISACLGMYKMYKLNKQKQLTITV